MSVAGFGVACLNRDLASSLFLSIRLAMGLIDKSARVFEFIKNGYWCFPDPIDDRTLEVWQQIQNTVQFDLSKDDKIRWKADRSGKFSIASAWNQLRNHYSEVSWHKILWRNGHIP